MSSFLLLELAGGLDIWVIISFCLFFTVIYKLNRHTSQMKYRGGGLEAVTLNWIDCSKIYKIYKAINIDNNIFYFKHIFDNINFNFKAQNASIPPSQILYF